MASVISNREEDLAKEVEQRTAELNQSQLELKRQKEYVDETIEGMDQGIIMTDDDLEILAYNSRYPEILEMPEDVIENHNNYADVIRYFSNNVMNHPPEKVEELIEKAKSKEKFVYSVDLPTGKIIEIRHIPKEAGGYIRIFTDITEREQIKREATKQKAIAEKTMDNIEQGIIMYDENMKVLAYNEKYTHIIDIPVDVISAADSYADLIRYTSEEILNQPDRTNEVIEKAKSDSPFTYLVHFPYGKIVEIDHFPIPEGGAVRTFSDVTNREKAQSDLEQRLQDLADARKASLNMMKDAEALRIKARSSD